MDHDELVGLADPLRSVGRPMRTAILEHTDKVGEVSPRAFTRSHPASLATASHHFWVLPRAALIQLLRTQPRRRAVEQFYVLSVPGRALLGWIRTAPARSDASS